MRLIGVSAISLTMLVATSCSAPAKAGCADPQDSSAVTIADFSFRPGCVAVAVGATLTLTNDDSIPHTFTVQGTNVDVTLASDQTTSVALAGLAAGTYSVICRYHPQMVEGLRVG